MESRVECRRGDAWHMDDLLSLAQAADRLGIAPVTLRVAVGRGRFHARKIGKTWVTTDAEVDRYRREHLGRRGRPRKERPTSMNARSRDGQVYGG